MFASVYNLVPLVMLRSGTRQGVAVIQKGQARPRLSAPRRLLPNRRYGVRPGLDIWLRRPQITRIRNPSFRVRNARFGIGH